MQLDEIQSLLESSIDQAKVQINCDDGKHLAVVVVSPAFEGLGPVKRQQLVYSVLNDAIASGAIHAVQMKTLTPDQWAAQNG
ncbi:Acid stress-induced BolA-like protein IbaG/YrbA, predicted regulator of iron metabolism [Alteromonadaceae bacterium Bs31]|nr:Acid stress-induced BolA-like protein IbaG/YrbA, predicted regulator of iron metabolism [Alteromonadaceae bacterium Bs31]